MGDLINLVKQSDNCHTVFFNTKDIGQFIRDVDGFFYFFPLKYEGGCWSDYSLRLIADRLEEINKPWEDYIKENIK